MSHEHSVTSSSIFRRRHFLKTFGLALGGVTLNQFSSTVARASGASEASLQNLHSIPSIGLLLPETRMHPMLGANVKAGLELCFSQARREHGTSWDGVHVEEYGVSTAAAIKAAEKLIGQKNVGMLVAVLNPHVAVSLHDILESHRTFLIVADAGANVPRDGEQSPYIFTNTLNYWRSNWAMGEWAVKQYGKKVFVASSLYESGYDALYAFRLGAERAGGQIVKNFVSHIPPDQADLTRLMQEIANANPHVVHASYSGREGLEFMKAYSAAGLAQKIPLSTSAFMMDEPLLGEVGSDALGVRSILAWSPTLDTVENRTFVRAFAKSNGRNPDAFAVVGYDTGGLILAGLAATGGDVANPNKLRDALRRASFAGPRGIVRMNPQTHGTTAPLYLCQVSRKGSMLVNDVMDEVKTASDHHTTLVALHAEERTGWLNTYLSA